MKSTVKAMFGTLCPWGKFWLYLGLAALVAAAWMSFAVGWRMTAAHAVFLAILSFVTAFLPMAAERVWQDGRKAVSIVLAALAIPLFMVEFGQHAAYTAGIRGHDLTTAKVQNIRYDGAQSDVAESKRLLETFTARLVELETKNGWAAATTAVALRANLDAAQKSIDLEAARGGCKGKCLNLMKEKASLEERIAKLEERKDLTDRIEATRAVIVKARTKAATTEHVSSQTEHMNAFLSKAVALLGKGTLVPDAHTEEGTQLSANLAMALAGTGLPALALFVAGLYRRREEGSDHQAPAQPLVAYTAIAPPAPRVNLAVGRAVFG